MMRTLLVAGLLLLAALTSIMPADAAQSGGQNPPAAPGGKGAKRERISTTLPLVAQAGGGGAGDVSQAADLARLGQRIAILESGRQDLSAWASIFVGILALLAAANVGLSIWQVGSIARNEVEKLSGEYAKQFVRFLQHGQSEISAKLKEYEAQTSDLAHQIDAVSATAREYSVMNSALLADLGREEAEAIARIRSEGDRLRREIIRIQAAANGQAGAE